MKSEYTPTLHKKEEKMASAIDHAKEALKNREMPIAACIFLDDELVAKAYTTEKADERLLVHVAR